MRRLGLTTLVTLLIALALAPAVGAAGTIAAPSGVSGSSTTGGVRISWNRVDGAGGYNVYRDNAYLTTVNAPPYTESISGTHNYYVTAFDSSKTVFSSRSSEVRVTAGEDEPRASAPAAPRNLTAGYSNGKTVLSWSASSGAAGYNVYRNNSYVTTVTGTSWNEPAGGHRYYVTAFDSTKTKFSSRSNEVVGVDEGQAEREAEAARRAEEERRAEEARRAEQEAEEARTAREAEEARRAEQEAEEARTAREAQEARRAEQEAEEARTAREAEDARRAEEEREVKEIEDARRVEEQQPTDVQPVADEPQVSVRPDAPQNLSVVNNNDRSQLTWSRVDGAGGYNIYRNGIYLTTVSGTSWTDSIEPNNYRYYVTAFNQAKDQYSVRSGEVIGLAPPRNEPTPSTSDGDDSGVIDAFDQMPVTTVNDDQQDDVVQSTEPTSATVPNNDQPIDEPDDDSPEPSVEPEPVVIRDPEDFIVDGDDGGDDGGHDDGDGNDDESNQGDEAPTADDETVDSDDTLSPGDPVGEPAADEEPAPPTPTPPRPSDDAQPDAPVVIRDEDDDALEPDTDDDTDGPDPDTDDEPAPADGYDWPNVEPDGLDVYDGEEGGETYPTEEQEIGEGDYGGDQGGEPGSVPENATGGPDSVTTGQTSDGNSGVQLESETVDGLADSEDAPAGTMTSEQTTAGVSGDVTIVSGSATMTTSSTQLVVHNADGTTVVSNQDDIDIGGELGVGIAVAGLDVGAGLTDTHIIENSGPTAVVQDALENGNVIDTSDVTAVPEGMTVTEIGEPGFDLFDSGTTELTTLTGGGISIEIDLPGGLDAEASLDQSSGTIEDSVQSGIPTTTITNNGDSITVGSGDTSIVETEFTVNTNQTGIAAGDLGAVTGDIVTITNSMQHTETINITHANSANGQTAAQQQADSGEPVLGADGLYDVTTQTTATHTETFAPTAIEVSVPGGTHSDGSPMVTNLEVEQETATTHMQGEPGGTPDLDFGLFDFTDSDDEIGQSSNHTITESVDSGEEGFHVGQSSNGQVPLAEPVEVATASTTGGLTLEMTPDELQANAQEALQSNPDNPVLQDLAAGATLPEAVNNDANTGVEIITVGHDNSATLEALEALAVEEALADDEVTPEPEPTPAPTPPPTPAPRPAPRPAQTNSDSDYDSFGHNQTEAQTEAANESANANQESYEEAAYGTTTTTTTTTNNGGSSSSDESRVICTYFYQNGRLDRSDWVADLRFTQQNIGTQTVRGYHAWGIPAVRLMRSGSRVGRIIEPALHFIAVHRAAELAHKMGRRDTPDYMGKLIRRTMEPMCWMIGAFVGEQNWRALYASNTPAPVVVGR